MIPHKELDAQLKALGNPIKLWGRAEAKELANILIPNEILKYVLNGSYAGGFALLAVTDQRLLLVDKKFTSLTIENIRYDMIAEIDFSSRLFGATVNIMTLQKTLSFTTMYPAKLRELATLVQHYVMELRHQPQHQPSTPALVYAATQTEPERNLGALNYKVRYQNPYTKIPLMTKRRYGKFVLGQAGRK